MRKIAIANQKGGCGKTTTAVNLSAALAAKGRRVLIVDLDPQAHTTLGLGHDPDQLNKTIYDTLVNAQVSLATVIMKTSIKGLELAPSNVLLSGAELELATQTGRELILNRRLSSIEANYDVCIIDCSPSLGLLTLNALVAGTDVIVPVQVHYYAMEGLKQLLQTIDIVKSRFNPDLKIAGVLLTFVEDRTLLSKDVQRQMREFFGDLVFDTVIRKSVRLAEAPSAGEPIITYDVSGRATREYLALADEVTNGETKSRAT
jgi:chromosome partitioning protein